MSIICDSQLLRDEGIDGHALCPHWDLCQYRLGDGRYVPPCTRAGTNTYACIERGLSNISSITVAQVIAEE